MGNIANIIRAFEQLSGAINLRSKDGPRVQTKCYECKHKENLSYTHHVACAKPCANVTGSPHGIRKGWFMYPLEFDPVWMTTQCSTFESAESISPAVSNPVSPE